MHILHEFYFSFLQSAAIMWQTQRLQQDSNPLIQHPNTHLFQFHHFVIFNCRERQKETVRSYTTVPAADTFQEKLHIPCQ